MRLVRICGKSRDPQEAAPRLRPLPSGLLGRNGHRRRLITVHAATARMRSAEPAVGGQVSARHHTCRPLRGVVALDEENLVPPWSVGRARMRAYALQQVPHPARPGDPDGPRRPSGAGRPRLTGVFRIASQLTRQGRSFSGFRTTQMCLIRSPANTVAMAPSCRATKPGSQPGSDPCPQPAWLTTPRDRLLPRDPVAVRVLPPLQPGHLG